MFFIIEKSRCFNNNGFRLYGAESGTRTRTPGSGTRSLVLRVCQFHHFCLSKTIQREPELIPELFPEKFPVVQMFLQELQEQVVRVKLHLPAVHQYLPEVEHL